MVIFQFANWQLLNYQRVNPSRLSVGEALLLRRATWWCPALSLTAIRLEMAIFVVEIRWLQNLWQKVQSSGHGKMCWVWETMHIQVINYEKTEVTR